MPSAKPENIRNVVLLGHAGTGKTTLTDCVLYKSKLTNRFGSVDEGTSLSDYEDDEKDKKYSIHATLFHIDREGVQINWIDAPGYPDMVGEAVCALSAADTALILVSAAQGVTLQTHKAFERAGELGIARWFVVSKLDAEEADFERTVDQIREAFGTMCVPLLYPVGKGGSFDHDINVLEPGETPPAEIKDSIAIYGENIKDAIVMVDESLMEKYLEGSITLDELRSNFTKAIVQGTVFPIVAVSSKNESGVNKLMDAIVRYAPSPVARGPVAGTTAGKDKKPVSLPAKLDGHLAGRVFKLLRHPFVGKICYVRLYSGTIKDGEHLVIPNRDKTFKVANMSRPQGKETQVVHEAGAGDIVALAKIEDLNLGDSISMKNDPMEFPSPEYPTPMVALAVEPKTRADEQKISDALHKLADEDPTFTATRDKQTAEMVIRGVSTLHIQLKLSALKKRFEVEVETKTPKIPYHETITRKAREQYTHRKQSGGSGQYARVEIEVEPTPRGEGFEFKSGIVGGVISSQFIPSIERGIRTVLETGVVAGYPIVDVKVTVVDGKEHPVDSKDIAFQVAGREAFKAAFEKCHPELLEPIVNLEITVPSQFMGDVSGYLSSHRGRPVGMEAIGDLQTIQAQIPMAEIMNFSTDLQSMTGGLGSYAFTPSHYEVVPSHLKNKIIDAHKKEEEEKAKKK